MVSRTSSHTPVTEPAADFSAWLRQQPWLQDGGDDLVQRTAGLLQDIMAAQSTGQQLRIFEFGRDITGALTDMGSDSELLCAALMLRPVQDGCLDLETLGGKLGEEVAGLVRDAGRIRVFDVNYLIEPDGGKGQEQRQENLRRMLLALARDIRVVLLILASRLVLLRLIKDAGEPLRQAMARETMDIYAPLANRLGVGHLKWEMEDLAFRYLQPDTYKDLARELDGKRMDRESYIRSFCDELIRLMAELRINGEVSGRPKHIYSIWRKMRRKNLAFDQLFDIRAVRVLVPEVADCYAMLGAIHSRWSYIRDEFDDYIASPKGNNYQSLHTAIIGPEGKIVEVQIRTRTMHEDAELGVAAHWRYKEGGDSDRNYDRKIKWMRQILEWRNDISDADDFADRLQDDAFDDRVYVMTPQGRIFDLPRGSTPVDFAYTVHTEVGHHCRGAKVNGRIVPLTTPLQSGQVVEIMTIREGGPSRDWLNSELGFVATSRARSKIQSWFRLQNHDFNVEEGRNRLEKELHRLNFVNINIERLAGQLKFDNPEKLYAALGRGDIRLGHIISQLQEQLQPAQPEPEVPHLAEKKGAPGKAQVLVEGVGDLMVSYARCCSPVPGDDITGYITRNRGIAIHRQDCANVLRYRHESPERLVSVQWAGQPRGQYPVQIHLTAWDRQGLLRDIGTVLSNEKHNLVAINTYTDKKTNLAHMEFTIEIENLGQLSRVLNLIGQLPNVIEVQRRQ